MSISAHDDAREPLTAAVNRTELVKKQLRDRKGRWVEMGALGKWADKAGNLFNGNVAEIKGESARMTEVRSAKNHNRVLSDQWVHYSDLEIIDEKADLDDIGKPGPVAQAEDKAPDVKATAPVGEPTNFDFGFDKPEDWEWVGSMEDPNGDESFAFNTANGNRVIARTRGSMFGATASNPFDYAFAVYSGESDKPFDAKPDQSKHLGTAQFAGGVAALETKHDDNGNLAEKYSNFINAQDQHELQAALSQVEQLMSENGFDGESSQWEDAAAAIADLYDGLDADSDISKANFTKQLDDAKAAIKQVAAALDPDSEDGAKLQDAVDRINAAHPDKKNKTPRATLPPEVAQDVHTNGVGTPDAAAEADAKADPEFDLSKFDTAADPNTPGETVPTLPTSFDGELDYSQQESLDKYVGIWSDPINGYLRAGEPSPFTKEIADLDNVIGRSTLDEDTTLYRGADGSGWLHGIKPGSTLSDPAFLSTSADHDVASGFADMAVSPYFFEISVPAGSNVLDVRKHSKNKDIAALESEYLLPRNSEIVVESVEDYVTAKGVKGRLVKAKLAQAKKEEGHGGPAEANVPGDANSGADAPGAATPDVVDGGPGQGDGPGGGADAADFGDVAEPAKKFEILDDPGANGDGYYPDALPTKLWGKYGAAGVMLRHVDNDGTERFLMVQRGPIVSTNKGKWQLPGGALNSKENDYQGTARELWEELSTPDGYLDSIAAKGEVRMDHESGWHYTNIAADVPEQFTPKVDGTETGDAKWLTKEEIAQLPLHPALEKNLDQIFGAFSSDDNGNAAGTFTPPTNSELYAAPVGAKIRIKTTNGQLWDYTKTPHQTWANKHNQSFSSSHVTEKIVGEKGGEIVAFSEDGDFSHLPEAKGVAGEADVPNVNEPNAPETPDAPANQTDEGLAQAAAEANDAPIDVSTWKKVGAQAGSNPGGVYEAPDGRKYYVKQSKSEEHAKNEVLADDFYQLAGIDTSKLKLADVDGKGKVGTASEMLEDAQPNLKQKLNDPAYKKKLQEGFAMDAWLANWDVAGLVFDNVVTDKDGNPVRIDPGGALLYRAQGAPKGNLFGDKVGEWDTLRDSNFNYQSGSLFGDMTDEQLKASAQKVLDISPEQIDAQVDRLDFSPESAQKLKDTLKARREDIAKRAGLDLPENAAPSSAETPNTPYVMPEDGMVGWTHPNQKKPADGTVGTKTFTPAEVETSFDNWLDGLPSGARLKPTLVGMGDGMTSVTKDNNGDWRDDKGNLVDPNLIDWNAYDTKRPRMGEPYSSNLPDDQVNEPDIPEEPDYAGNADAWVQAVQNETPEAKNGVYSFPGYPAEFAPDPESGEWYDAEGNKLTDVKAIEKLDNAYHANNPPANEISEPGSTDDGKWDVSYGPSMDSLDAAPLNSKFVSANGHVWEKTPNGWKRTDGGQSNDLALQLDLKWGGGEDSELHTPKQNADAPEEPPGLLEGDPVESVEDLIMLPAGSIVRIDNDNETRDFTKQPDGTWVDQNGKSADQYNELLSAIDYGELHVKSLGGGGDSSSNDSGVPRYDPLDEKPLSTGDLIDDAYQLDALPAGSTIDVGVGSDYDGNPTAYVVYTKGDDGNWNPPKGDHRPPATTGMLAGPMFNGHVSFLSKPDENAPDTTPDTTPNAPSTPSNGASYPQKEWKVGDEVYTSGHLDDLPPGSVVEYHSNGFTDKYVKHSDGAWYGSNGPDDLVDSEELGKEAYDGNVFYAGHDNNVAPDYGAQTPEMNTPDSGLPPAVEPGVVGVDANGAKYVMASDGKHVMVGTTVKSKTDGLEGEVVTVEGNGHYVKVKSPDGKTKGRKLSTLEVTGGKQPVGDNAPDASPDVTPDDAEVHSFDTGVETPKVTSDDAKMLDEQFATPAPAAPVAEPNTATDEPLQDWEKELLGIPTSVETLDEAPTGSTFISKGSNGLGQEVTWTKQANGKWSSGGKYPAYLPSNVFKTAIDNGSLSDMKWADNSPEAPAVPDAPPAPEAAVPSTLPDVPWKSVGIDGAGKKYVMSADGKPMGVGTIVKSKTDGFEGPIVAVEGNGTHVRVGTPDGKWKGRAIKTLTVTGGETPVPHPAKADEPTPSAPEAPSAPSAPEASAAPGIADLKAGDTVPSVQALDDMPVGSQVYWDGNEGFSYYQKLPNGAWQEHSAVTHKPTYEAPSTSSEFAEANGNFPGEWRVQKIADASTEKYAPGQGIKATQDLVDAPAGTFVGSPTVPDGYIKDADGKWYQVNAAGEKGGIGHPSYSVYNYGTSVGWQYKDAPSSTPATPDGLKQGDVVPNPSALSDLPEGTIVQVGDGKHYVKNGDFWYFTNPSNGYVGDFKTKPTSVFIKGGGNGPTIHSLPDAAPSTPTPEPAKPDTTPDGGNLKKIESTDFYASAPIGTVVTTNGTATYEKIGESKWLLTKDSDGVDLTGIKQTNPPVSDFAMKLIHGYDSVDMHEVLPDSGKPAGPSPEAIKAMNETIPGVQLKGSNGVAFKKGDRVSHPKFGMGTVKTVEGNGTHARVVFDNSPIPGKSQGISGGKLTKIGPDGKPAPMNGAPHNAPGAPSVVNQNVPSATSFTPAPFTYTAPKVTTIDDFKPDPTSPYFNQPKPVYPTKEAVGGVSWVPDGWLEEASAYYKSHKNKDIQQSSYWQYVQNVINNGDEASLTKISKSMISKELSAKAAESIKAARAVNEVADAKHAAAVSKWKDDVAAWEKANGKVPANFVPGIQLSETPFLGGDADWSKAHYGTANAINTINAVTESVELSRRGSSFAADAGAIEDFDVRVFRNHDVDGQTQMEYRFKLTAPHADSIASASELKKRGFEKTSGTNFEGMKNNPDTGLKQYTKSIAFNGGGETWTHTDPETGVKVQFFRVGSTTINDAPSRHNMVRVFAPDGTGVEAVSAALERLGVDAKPASEKDIRYFAENKMISILGGRLDSVNWLSATHARQKVLDDIEKKYGITLADLHYGHDENGRMKMYLSDEARDKIIAYTGLGGMSHSLSGGSDANILEHILSGSVKGLIPTMQRYSEGISSEFGIMGSSPTSDINHAGSDGIFATAIKGKHVVASGYGTVVMHPKAVARRLDFWSVNGDGWGKRPKNSNPIEMLKGSPYENVFKSGIPVSEMWYVSVQAQTRDALIKRLKAKGIYSINGIPLENFILTSGMPVPEYDDSYFSSAKLPPAVTQ